MNKNRIFSTNVTNNLYNSNVQLGFYLAGLIEGDGNI